LRTPDPKNRSVEIEIVGKIANMVALFPGAAGKMPYRRNVGGRESSIWPRTTFAGRRDLIRIKARDPGIPMSPPAENAPAGRE
jgi:hypothetical protein